MYQGRAGGWLWTRGGGVRWDRGVESRVWAIQKNENYGLYRNFLMAPGSHICMFKYSFVAWKISSLNIFCVFVFLFRAHFRISCMSEINMQESKSKFWHLLYFSHISIDWFQIFACLVQECESEIMFSVSTLSTLKYLQKKNTFWMILQKILHVLHFQSRYFLSL